MMTMPEQTEKPSWDKQLVITLKERGLTHEHAMIAVGETAEHRQTAYMEGHNKGYDEGWNAAIDDANAVFRGKRENGDYI